MKKAIFQSALTGAQVGFSLAILNSIWVLVALEFSWPVPEPKLIVIFTRDFITRDLLAFLFTTLEWAIPSALVGGIAAGLFSYILFRYKLDKKHYVLTCTKICVTLAVIYISGWVGFMAMGGYGANRLLELIFESPLVGFVLVILPAILFVSAGFIVSRHLHERFSNSANVNPATA
jgi:hypothetical protein